MRVPLLPGARQVTKKRTAAAVVGTALFGLALATGGASADPLTKPAYVVACGGTTYETVSQTHASVGLDVNSTDVFVEVRRGVPQRLLTACTVTPVSGGESFSGSFLITPAAKGGF